MTSNRLTHRVVTHVATPVVSVVFLVLGTTGLMMFFHVGERFIKEMHEWFGVVFVVATGAHVYRNRKAIFVYFKKSPIKIAAGVVAVAAAAFLAAASLEGPPGAGAGALMSRVERASLSDLAPILETTPDVLVEKLRARGYQVEGESESLESVARASGIEPRRAIGDLLDASDKGRRQGRGGPE